jgi:hypothetical protein
VNGNSTRTTRKQAVTRDSIAVRMCDWRARRAPHRFPPSIAPHRAGCRLKTGEKQPVSDCLAGKT